MGKETKLTLFGGDKGWDESDWTASDDRVRGGKSQSYLTVKDSKAHFHGNLDIKTLGGAGFASQRTVGEDGSWDLSDYDGIKINLGKSDGKRYTFILKDELLPKNPENGREQSTVSYEYDFNVNDDAVMAENSFVFVRWEDLKPTYRGKEKKDAPKLTTKKVKRFSIMMRSFFGDQEGDFSLTIKSITAVSVPEDLEKSSLKDAAASDGWSSQGKLAGRQGRLIFSKSTCMVTLGLVVATLGACKAFCPWILEDLYALWPFGERMAR